MGVRWIFSFNTQQESECVFSRNVEMFLLFVCVPVLNSDSICSCCAVGPFYGYEQQTYSTTLLHGCITNINLHMGDVHCCWVVVSCCVCVCVWEIRIIREQRQNSDELTHVYICTHSHTLYLATWLIMASLGVLEEVQKKPYQLQKDFFLSPQLVYSSLSSQD